MFTQVARRRLLKRIYEFYQQNPEPTKFTLVEGLKGFRSKKQSAKLPPLLLQLFDEGFLIGIAAPQPDQPPGVKGRLCVRLNPDRVEDVRKELQSGWYRDPRFLIPTVIALAATAAAILKFLIDISN